MIEREDASRFRVMTVRKLGRPKMDDRKREEGCVGFTQPRGATALCHAGTASDALGSAWASD